MVRRAAVLLCLLAVAGCGGSSKPARFTNPVFRGDFPDPYVLRVGDTYWAYATNSGGRNIQSLRSRDLVHWSGLHDAMPALAAWTTPGKVWAPEVARVGGRYVMFYATYGTREGVQCVGRAVARAPGGPFRDTGTDAFVCQPDEGGSIDPDVFRDADGSLYLLWKNDGNCCGKATYLYSQRLSPDASRLVGRRVRLLTADQWLWEGPLVEAPTLWHEHGRYTLFFSASVYNSPDYAVGYATCAGPLGPCKSSPRNPILKSACRAAGPGHQAIVQAPDGSDWIVYHAWKAGAIDRAPGRQLWLDRLEWKDGAPVVRGPTCTAQDAPS